MFTKRNQLVLPPDLLEVRLSETPVGSKGYVVPWAMQVDEEGKCWMDPAHILHANPGGTVSLFVEKIVGGWLVDIKNFNYSGEKYRWDKSNLVREGSQPVYAR